MQEATDNVGKAHAEDDPKSGYRTPSRQHPPSWAGEGRLFLIEYVRGPFRGPFFVGAVANHTAKGARRNRPQNGRNRSQPDFNTFSNFKGVDKEICPRRTV